MAGKHTLELKTKRLLITPLSDEELRTAMEAEGDGHMRAALGEMLEGALGRPEARNWYTQWAITRREDGVPLGSLCFKGPPVSGAVEIGYGIDRAHRGQGFAAEAAAAAMDWAFGQEEVYFITAETEGDNYASQRVLDKLGFAATGQGQEGPRFEKEKEASSWMVTYMCLGLSMGLCFGLPADNMSLGMCLGMGAGVALGAVMDSQDRKKRAQLRAERERAAKRSETQ